MEGVDFYKNNSQNKNTSYATNSWHRNFVRWASEENKRVDIENMEKVELNRLIFVFLFLFICFPFSDFQMFSRIVLLYMR